MEKIYQDLKNGLKDIRDVDTRIEYLKKLRMSIVNNKDGIVKALHDDFNKPEFETLSTEIFGVIGEIDLFIKKLGKWSKPESVRPSILNFPSSGYIYKEPMGVVYICSPWNYPFNLAMTPLVGAIGAGNTVLLRPSQSSLNSAHIIEKICKEVFPENIVHVFVGDHDLADKILDMDLDMVFFTGSPRIGREIYKRATNSFARVVLELGGKSPVIVLNDADCQKTAKRLVWGKYLNGGQTCVAPDYVIVQEKVKPALIEWLIKYIGEFYYTSEGLTDNFPHIINEKNYERLKQHLTGNILVGGKFDNEKRLIYPTIIDNITLDSPIMKEEIFGPIMPLITIKDVDEVYPIIEANPNPLAAYIFTSNMKAAETLVDNIKCGDACINDTVMHLTSDTLPFGGIKTSGLGSYHGYESFKVFSHYKSVLNKSLKGEISVKYPPYTKEKIKFLEEFGKIK
ncbi:MAG: aldehyde dehydrogenase family protein [Bacilli bacterium]